jgi:hypothetical protein
MYRYELKTPDGDDAGTFTTTQAPHNQSVERKASQ